MSVVVDTSVWSLVLRRSKPNAVLVREVNRLIAPGRVKMLGVIRQELLSGVVGAERFSALRDELAHFVDVPIATQDHEEAASMFNRCRSKGVQGNVVDMLICAISRRHGFEIFTTDRDFTLYADHIPIKLYKSSL